MQKLSIRNKLFLRLKEASLLVNEEVCLQKEDEQYNSTEYNHKSFKNQEVASNKIHCDYQEIYFGSPDLLLKYLILLKDKPFLEEFCEIFNIEKEAYLQCVQLIGLDNDQSHSEDLIKNIESVLSRSNKPNQMKEILEISSDISLILSSPLFKNFQNLPTLKVSSSNLIFFNFLSKENINSQESEINPSDPTTLAKEIQFNKDLSLSFRREIVMKPLSIQLNRY